MAKAVIIDYRVIPNENPGDEQWFGIIEEETRRIERRVTIEQLDEELEALEERKQEIIEIKAELAEKLREMLEALWGEGT